MRFHLQQSIVTVIITTLLPTVYTLPANSHLEKYPAYDYGGSKSKLFERQSSGPIVTTGVKVGVGQNGSLPLRIEIREMQKDTTMWTLYLLGLDFMQRNKSQSDMESWYQVAGKCSCYG
jgi:tyrosinase